MNWSQPQSQQERRGGEGHAWLLFFQVPRSKCLPFTPTPIPPHPCFLKFILFQFWSHVFCFLFSTRETELGLQKNKAWLPTGNVCSGGEFGGWRQAGQDLCQWNVIWGGSCRSLNCWQPAREQLDAFWAVYVSADVFPSCKHSPGDVEKEALEHTRHGVWKIRGAGGW